jgi:heparan-sulfate lyase
MDDIFPETYREKIEKMCEAVMKLSPPDGTSTMFGSDTRLSPGTRWNNLRQWAARWDRPDFLYVASEGAEGTRPQGTAFAYPYSGLFSMRSGWDANAIFFSLKCGPDGGPHSHRDNGTFELYAGGRVLMPDSGLYILSGDPVYRDWFRQTRVHQTLTLNERNIAYDPKLLVWQPSDFQSGENLDILVVENQSYINLTHRRAVFFVDKSYFIIVDEATGWGRGNVNLHFQLAPGEKIFDFPNLSAQTAFSEGWNVMVKNVISSDTVTMEEEEGQVSSRVAVREPRPAFRFRINKNRARANVRFVTLIVPYEGTIPPDINVEIEGSPAIRGNALNLLVTKNGITQRIGYSITRQ